MSKRLAEQISSGLTVFSVFSGVGLLFSDLMPWDAVGKVFGVLCILSFLTGLFLLLRFPELYLFETKKELIKKGLDHQYVNMDMPLVAPGAFATLGILSEVNIARWWELVIASVVLMAILAGLFWKFNSHLRSKPVELIGAVLLVGMLQPGLIWQVNELLDFAEPEYIQVEVQDIGKTRHRKGPDSYYFVTELNGDDRRIKVDLHQWKELDIGEDVTLAIHTGGLGMEYYVLTEPQ